MVYSTSTFIIYGYFRVRNEHFKTTIMKKILLLLVVVPTLILGQNGSFHERRIAVSSYVAQNLDSINPKKELIGILVKLNYNSEEILESTQFFAVHNKQELLLSNGDLNSLRQISVWGKLKEQVSTVFGIDVSPFDDEYTAERTLYLPLQTAEILATQKIWNQEEREKWRKWVKQEITYVAKVNNLKVGKDSIQQTQVKTKLYGYASEQITLGNNFVLFFRLLETSEDGQRVFFADVKVFHKENQLLKKVYEVNRTKLEGYTLMLNVSPFVLNGSIIPETAIDLKVDFTKRLFD